MKRIILSLVMVTAVASLAVAATRAYFTSTVKNTGNVLGTGTLTVELTGKTATSQTKIFDVSGLAPGGEVKGCFQVANTGKMPLVFRAYVERTSTVPNDTFMDQIMVESIVLNSDNCLVDEAYQRYGPEEPKELEIPEDMTLRDLTNKSNALNNISAALEETPWPLFEDYASTYYVTLKMPETVGNAYQNASFTGNLVVEALQYDYIDLNTTPIPWPSN